MNSSTKRETFSSGYGLLITMIGVAVGLGNIWRFPYMVGKFGGASFVLFYLVMVLLVGIPALMAEWALGRYTRRGTLGAFDKGGLPGGKFVGFFFIFIVFFSSAYYTNAVGWVGYHAFGQVANIVGGAVDASLVLPPEEGFRGASLLRQMVMTGLVLLCSCVVLIKGVRKGIEKVSKYIMPVLFVILIVLIVRAVSLPGAGKGLQWYLGDFRLANLTGPVMAAALGHAIFSMSLGGTFMVAYGSYLDRSASIPKNAFIIGIGDLLAGLMGGLAIFPAVFALNLEPASGPGLIFDTLPKTFAKMGGGAFFGAIFFVGLFAAAFLSLIAAFEVLVAGLTDNFSLSRKSAVILVCSVVFFLAVPPMINMKVFVPWDLFFGSGMQTLGALLAVVTAVWCIKKSEALKELTQGSRNKHPRLMVLLYWWMRIVIPVAVLFVGINWLLESVFEIKIFM